MSNEIQLFDNTQLTLIKNMFFKGLDNDNMQVFLHVCKRTMLDPFRKQIYAVMRYDSKVGKEAMTIQTGIDGYRLIAERTGRYAPGREPTYCYGENNKIISSTAYVKKMTEDGTWHEIAATAFFDEYCQRTKEGKPTQFWLKMGHTMIAKCAEALALRKAFPADLSGLYTKEEMLQADTEVVEAEAIHVKQDIQIENQEKEKAEYQLLNEFLAQYPNENPDRICLFLGFMKDSWKKDLTHVINLYRDHEKFMNHFERWNKKYPERAA